MTTRLAQRPGGEQPVGPEPRDGRTTTRRCIASGELHAKCDLLRFVVAPDGSLVFDLAGKLPGRGLWLLPRRDMLDKACARRLFARAARVAIVVPEDLPEQVVRALRERCLGLLGFARRAGDLTGGFEKVRSWLSSGRVGLLLQAVDAAEGGRQKLRGLARAIAPAPPVFEVFTAAELGRALGRDAMVHVAIAPGLLAERLAAELARLQAIVLDDAGETRT